MTKGTRCLNFVMRVLRGTHWQVKVQAYKTLVRPVLEYGGMVWDPYRLGQVEEMERVQRQAARRVTGRMKRWRWDATKKSREHVSVSKIIQQLGWESLSQRRKKARLCGLHRALSDTEGWREIRAGIEETQNGRYGQRLREKGANMEVGRNAFLARTIREWNLLEKSLCENAVKISPKLFSKYLD